MYRFKFYQNDIIKISGGCSKTPETLYNDFDGLMDWDEFNNISSKNMSTHDVLVLALRIYKDCNRIEIINDETNEVVDYINRR